jgi:hypothetical protein
MSITDANFTYAVVSAVDRTLAITGINPANAIYGNANWGTFPAIPSTYGGSNTAYNGNGVPVNAFKVVEIGANAFESLTAFSQTTLTAAFLPANLKRIGERAFAGVKLSGTLTVPATVDSVGVQAFYNTLITGIVIGSSTNSDIVAHLADLTSVINQEIADRAAADASLDLLKAPIHDPAFTGTATVPSAAIGLATISSASVAAANINVANLTSASLSTANIVGNAAFAGSVSATGQWTFTVQPKINGELVATESYVNSGIASIAGPGLASALDTLSELASAIGGDPSFATNIINSHTSISATLSTEVSVRSAAAASLSSALSTSASSLAVVDSGLSTAISAESSARIVSGASLSTALSTNVSDLQSKNSATSTALSAEISTRSSEVSAAHSTHSTSVASLQSVDAVLSTALSTEISARGSAVASLVPVVNASSASLSTADASLSTALSTETSNRVSVVASVSQVQSVAFSALSSANIALSSALSTEVSARSGDISLLSASASAKSVSLQITHAQFSIALASEAGARGTSASSLADSISASVSSFTSANVSTAAGLSTETLARSGAVSSASVSTTNAVASAGASILVHNTALGGETSVRASHIDALATSASASFASLATAHAAISSGLVAEGGNRSAATSAAIQNILSGAPMRFNTLEKIASELSNNQSLTLNASTLNVVSALRTAVSSETAARVSAVVSLSGAAVPSLSSAKASIGAALSTETSARMSAVASASGALSTASVSVAAVDVALSDALSAEAVSRNSAIVSINQAVASTTASLSTTDTTLSTALSTEVSTRQGGVASIDSVASLAFATLSLSTAGLNTAFSAETSARVSTVASASSAIAASFASLQSSDAAVKNNVSALSAGLALKATASYVDARLNTLLSGAPSQLDTLAEIAAALGNNPNFASSISAALLTKGTTAAVNSLSVQVAAKAALSDFNSVQSMANNAADSATLSAVISNVNAVNATVGALASAINSLQVTGGTVNASTIAVNGVDIPTVATRIQELYYKLGTANPSLGTVNPDGTINYKLNRLANPTLVSSVLGFEYDGNGAVTKVNHVITVQFDKDQKSVTVTGGVGNLTTTINNMVLNSSNQYVFTVAYAGNLAFYEANKTAVSIVALVTPYKLAPLVPTVVAPALNSATFVHNQPTIVENSMTVTKSGSTYTYTATFTNADNAVMEVLNPDDTVAAVQLTVNSPYAHTYDSSKFGSLIFKIRTKNTVSKLASTFLTINGMDVPPVLSNFTLGARAIGNGAIVLPQPTTTAPVTYTANTYNQVGQKLLFNNSTVTIGVTTYQNQSVVNISPDGTKILIGGIGGHSYGIVRVHSLDSSTNTWTQIGGDIVGDTYSGYAGGRSGKVTGFNVISMSADATLVVTVESGLGDSGTTRRVHVFKYDPSKNAAQSNSALPNFGPAKWSRVWTLTTGDNWSLPPCVALSADGKTMAVNYGASLIVYQSTDGGVTWTQKGSTLSSPSLDSMPYQKSVYISANGLQVLVATVKPQTSINPGALIMYEWNGSVWTSTTIRNIYSHDSAFEMAMSSDGKVVVSSWYNADNAYFERSHKNESGAWINNVYQFTQSFGMTNAIHLSADGSVLLICRMKSAYESYGDVEIHRWNGTEYVAVIANRSLTGRGSDNPNTFNAMLTADGTRFIVGHHVAHADVYDLVASSKFSFSTSNSAVVEVHGNLALLKTTGSSTITATQITATGNATIASGLTVVG